MVCEKCSLKLKHVATPDPWKMGGRTSLTDTASSSAGRKINENKALTASKFSNPISKNKKCRICAAKLHQEMAHYCQGCAYKKGICAMCGKKIQSTKSNFIYLINNNSYNLIRFIFF